MNGNFPPCLAFTLRPENDGNDFHQDPNDSGGATKWGITLSTLATWRRETGGSVPTADDLKVLQEWERDAIYATNYWDRVNGDQLPLGLDLMVFDFGVTSGAGVSAKALQRSLGFTARDVDGWVGPHTLLAVRKANAFTLISSLADLQTAYYRSLPTAYRYFHGWERRLDDRRRLAVSMLTHHAQEPQASAPPVTS